jgi:hypothetical protein
LKADNVTNNQNSVYWINDKNIDNAQKIIEERESFKYHSQNLKFDRMLLNSNITDEEL